MKSLTIKLRQHTPMLHFQGSQDYATLRASEVKPRLDRYIASHEFGDDFATCKEYLAGYDHARPDALHEKFQEGYRALNYKMRIQASDIDMIDKPHPRTKEQDTNAPMYFGYMGDRDDKSLAKASGIIMTIQIPDRCQDLADIILRHIGTMFANTNFATRKTKGYGSFTVIGPEEATSQIRRPKLYFESTKEKYSDVLTEIEWIHKTLRSGINDCFGKNLYFKSLMFAYAKSKGQQWDKRSIKQNFLDQETLRKESNKHDGADTVSYCTEPPHYDWRDCLGLSASENWMSYKMNLTKTSTAADRLASPILFKPVRYTECWRVYIVYEELPEAFKSGKVRIGARRNNRNMNLELGIYPEFSIQDYIDFVFKADASGEFAVDIADLFSNTTANDGKKNRILEIFEELRNNYNK